MKKINLTLLFLSCTLFVKSQNIECIKETKDILYIDFKIVSNYSIVMSGITTNFNIDSISKKNIDTFLKDFYNKCYYVPDIQNGYPEVLDKCPNFPKSKDGGYECLGMVKQLMKKSFKHKLKLETGETVHLEITRVIAEISPVAKNSMINLSYELDINTLDEIKKVYVILSIQKYFKPNKNNLRIKIPEISN